MGHFIHFLKLLKPLKLILSCEFLDVLNTQTTTGLWKEVSNWFYGDYSSGTFICYYNGQAEIQEFDKNLSEDKEL